MKLRLVLNFLACVNTLLQNKLPYHAFRGTYLFFGAE